MTITTFLDLSRLPNRTQEQKTFDELMSGLIQKLPQWGQEINSTLEALSSFASGGVYSFAYIFESAIAAVDPGTARLRLNSATQSSATSAYIDNITIGGANIASVLAAFATGTSLNKCAVRFTKMNDPSRWAIFDVTQLSPIGTSGTGYCSLTMQHRASSIASPFVDGDTLLVSFTRVGDRGLGTSLVQIAQPTTIGFNDPVPQVRYEISDAEAAQYSKYVIEVEAIGLRLSEGGRQPLVFTVLSPTGAVGMNLTGNVNSNSGSVTITIEVKNTSSQTAGYTAVKAITYEGVMTDNNVVSNISGKGSFLGGRVTGFSLQFGAGGAPNLMSRGSVRFFGVRSALN